MDIERIVGHWTAGGLEFSIVEDGGVLLMTGPATPDGFEPTLRPIADDRILVETGPFAGAELHVDRDGGLSLAGLLPISELTRAPAREPGSGLMPPPFDPTPEQRTQFERTWMSIVAQPDGRPVTDDLLGPVHTFVRWLMRRDEVIFHGSNDASIEVFQPVRRSMELHDHTSRGNQGAVYGTHDGLWSMFFAVVDRSRLRGSIRNGVGRYRSRTSDETIDVYQFSIADEMLPARPYTDGALYLMPRQAFTRIPLYPGGPPSSEWACPTPVKPLARVPISPEDFPFLHDIGGHDDGAIFDLLRLEDEVYRSVVSVSRIEDGFEVVTRASGEVVGRLIEASRTIYPDVDRTAVGHPEGTLLRMAGPEAFVHALERRLREHLD